MSVLRQINSGAAAHRQGAKTPDDVNVREGRVVGVATFECSSGKKKAVNMVAKSVGFAHDPLVVEVL